ncbi:MAG TPA: hypothetical protein VIY48_16380 [Candidatus Paceibacterota bacterium]
MDDLVIILDALRVISLLAAVVCQAFIARAMWMFAKHNVVAVSVGNMAWMAVMSTIMLGIATLLVAVKLALVN